MRIKKLIPEELKAEICSHYINNDPRHGYYDMRNKDVVALIHAGYSYRSIGMLFGITFQRVQQILWMAEGRKRDKNVQNKT